VLSRILLVAVLSTASNLFAAVPAGFQETTVVSGVSEPTTLAFLPDGRLLVAEKASGRLRLIKNGALLATPFLDVTQALAAPLTFDNYSERGLLGIAVDPAFATNSFVYIYYSVCKVAGSGTCQTAEASPGPG
jgi:glucose/arabinose dehydrogenase